MTVISLIIGLTSLVVGGNLLYRSVLDEAGNRIQHDLNVARLIYEEQIQDVRLSLELLASSSEFKQAVAENDRLRIGRFFRVLNDRLGLDFGGITDAGGHLLFPAGDSNALGVPLRNANPFVQHALENGQPVSGTAVMSNDQLGDENQELAAKAIIAIKPLARAAKSPSPRLGDGLTIGAAFPIELAGQPKGIVYGGFLLNHDTRLVDRIGDTVFRNETYQGRHVGTATVFLGDVRIATSVKDRSGHRAEGTYASVAVTRHVLDEGGRWTDRARVLDDWYVTAYESITDLTGRRVGMLYVGVLEAQYADVRTNAITVFAGITAIGIVIAIMLGWLFTRRIMRPVSHLIRASNEISSGNLAPDIGPISRDDIGHLQKKFLLMTDALKAMEERRKAESEIRLLQSEKQASVGKLAAGVAHEINNPLTAVLTFTHLLLGRKDLPDDARQDLETVAAQTERVREIVKSLLDFARQTEISPESMDINRLIADSVGLMQNQAHIKSIRLSFKGAPGLPTLILDRNQCQSVMINMIINALDATPAGGAIDIRTRRTEADESDGEGVEITVTDTGSGIAPEDMDKLFDPFFTTKAVGKGTGLGLAVSAGIIERHGGTIRVKSKLESGTTFTLWLPLRPEEVPSNRHRDRGGRNENTHR